MIFYKVLADGVLDPRTLEQTYKEELLTEKEMFRLYPYYAGNKKIFKKVKVLASRTYWFFGKRFEID